LRTRVALVVALSASSVFLSSDLPLASEREIIVPVYCGIVRAHAVPLLCCRASSTVRCVVHRPILL
jgi:hypothetical protein